MQCVFFPVLSTTLALDVLVVASLLCKAAVLVSVVRERRCSVGLANEYGHLFCFLKWYSCAFTCRIPFHQAAL
jgi:hypothetical protein